ncbi:MAG: trypsin-like peptidase domain-containing protein [Planctomycetaceae bacterium]|nr:trypsin-like peptidase domain-containing protein [Planctomycetaceae bacterium]
MRSVIIGVLLLSVAVSWAWAEVRTWSVSAEFVSLKPGSPQIAIMRRTDRTTFEVPLEQLSEADRAFIRTQLAMLAAASSTSTGAKVVVTNSAGKRITLDVPEVLKEVELNALECRTASEAVQVYKFFLAGPEITTDQRAAAEERIKHWLSLAEQKQLRLGDRWVTPEEYDDIKRKCDDMVQHSLELLRLKNHKLAREELVKASRFNPESEKADFLMGWIYALVARDDVKAIQHFAEATRRAPNNGYALNNLAVCEVFEKRYVLALEHFKKSLDLAPDKQPIAENLGATIESAARIRSVVIPKKTLDEFNDLYRMALRELKLKPGTKSLTFTLVTPYGKSFDRSGGDGVSGLLDEPQDAVVSTASGTGFVIAPGYVLTNHHVIEGATEIGVRDPEDRDKQYKAIVVASLEVPDLALLKVEGFNAPPLQLESKLPRRGTDLMALGFPLGNALGTELKTTRGAIISMSDPQLDGNCMIGAQINPGNSGGPIVDQQGNVIGVVVAKTYQERFISSYGIAIPCELVWPFLNKHLPDLKPVETGAAPLDWPDVDAKASPSTVFIMSLTRTTKSK